MPNITTDHAITYTNTSEITDVCNLTSTKTNNEKIIS